VVSFSDICFVSSLLVRSVVPCKLPQNLKLYSLQCVTDMAASATLSQCTVFNVTVSLARMVRGSTYTLMAPEVICLILPVIGLVISAISLCLKKEVGGELCQHKTQPHALHIGFKHSWQVSTNISLNWFNLVSSSFCQCNVFHNHVH